MVKANENIKECDYKICLYHGGIDFDPITKEIVENSGENIASRIIDAIDIDLILCGHQHLEILGVDYKGTKVIEPSFFGGKYAEIDINLENKDLKVKLHNIDGNFDEEKFSEEVLLNNKINEYIDRKIATLDKDYLPKDRLEMALNGSELASFINKIQLELTGADVSMNALVNEVSGFKKDLTIRQILNTLRYLNTLEVYEIDGKTLRRGLNKNFEYIVKDTNGYRINEDYIIPKLSHYNFDFYDGITYDIDLDKPFDSRIGNIYKDGRVIKDEEILTIVLNNYRSTVLLKACHQNKNNQKLSDILDLKEDKIKNIIVETTLTENKSEVVLEKKDYKKFLDKILSYNIVEKENDKAKGWQYAIKIEYDEDVHFSIMDNKIYLGDRMYISNNLDKNDLLYLFEDR